LQLAFSLGYKKALMVGFDHSYKQPKKALEGDVIDQREDDENHFDPRYFRGKKWQAADTANMEHTYELSKAAFEKDGREVVNCTVGGKLEVFRRGDLATELNIVGKRPKKPPVSIKTEDYPKLLLIDITQLGDCTTTGELKQNLLKDWPVGKLLHFYSLVQQQIGVSPEGKDQALLMQQILSTAKTFDPDVILYRPVADNMKLHETPM